MATIQEIKERARAQWAERSGGTVEVPEWDTTIHFKTPNLATLKTISNESNRDPIEIQARLVAVCATNDKGDRFFSKAEASELMTHYDPAIISRIAAAIMEKSRFATTPEEKAADEKN